MGFHSEVWPLDASYGTRSGPRWSTSIVKTDSDAEERNARWAFPHYVFDVGYVDKTRDNAQLLDKFLIARDGAHNSFLFFDWRDHASTTNGRVPTASDPSAPAVTKDDQQLGIGDGVETEFQIVKRYADASSTKLRPITKPISGTVLVALDGVLQTSGYSVNYQTGVITFTSAPGVGVVVTAGFQFYNVVRLDESQDRGGLGASLSAHDKVDYPPIRLVEDVTVYLLNEDYVYRGAYSEGMSADITISFLNGAVQTLIPTGAGLQAKLPDNSTMPQGGVIGWLYNTAAFSVEVVDFSDVHVATLAAASGSVPGSLELVLGAISGVPTWFAT